MEPNLPSSGVRVKESRPELPREFVAVHKRRRMMDAIAELSAERGYEATKVADVVRVAGVARKTLYDNFDGKEGLFLAAIEDWMAELRKRAEAAGRDVEGGWEARLEAGLGASLELVAALPNQARMCLVEAPSVGGQALRRHEEGLLELTRLLKRSVPPRSGLSPTTAEALVGGVVWIVGQRIRRGESASVPGLLPELSDFVLAPYRCLVEA